MFKQANFEDEIYRSMEKQLVTKQAGEQAQKLAKVIEYLSAAAEIFDQAGMVEQSEETIEVLHSLAVGNFK